MVFSHYIVTKSHYIDIMSDLLHSAETMIRSYYADVDQSTYIDKDTFRTRPEYIDKVMERFDENAAYVRAQEDASEETFNGKVSIRDFFEKKRSLVGTHKYSITEITEDPADASHVVHVEGQFSGQYCRRSEEDNSRIVTAHPVTLTFTDVWRVKNGLVMHRRSDIHPVQKNKAEVPESARYAGR